MASRHAHRPIPQTVPRIADVPEVKQNLPTPPPHGDRPPIVVVFGAPGIGKTTLLHQLHNGLHQKTPRALIDCDRYADGGIPALLTDVKRQFGRYCPGIGRLRFRRLEIGLAATRERIDFRGNQRNALRRLVDLVLREIYLLPKDIGDAAGEAADGVLPGPLTFLQGLMGKLVATASRLVSRRLLRWMLRRPWRWYGHRDQQRPDRAVDELADDELAELNSWAHDPSRHGQRDERLTEALLADVRHAFGRGRLARPGWYNCVLLLDNADSDVGKALLKHLHDLRDNLHIAKVAAEPLLVVATSRQALHGSVLAQHRMPELTEPELEWLAKYLPVEADHRFHKVLHQLTGGYPAAAAHLTAAAGHRPEVAAKSLGELLAVRAEHVDGGTTTIEEEALANLTDALLRQPEWPLPDGALDDLATCALACTQEDADWLAVNHVDGGVVDPELLERTDLWTEAGRSGAHTLLLQLLLRRLAAREASWPKPDWTAVCGLLGDRRRNLGDVRGELYYVLAQGEFDTVVRRLTERLPERDAAEPWLDLLTFVTAAPRRPGARTAASPYEEQVQLAGTVVEDGTSHLLETARLVAGLWLANDPCTSPNRKDLHEQLVLDLKRIAPDADRPIDLRNEAKRHEAIAHDWS